MLAYAALRFAVAGVRFWGWGWGLALVFRAGFPLPTSPKPLARLLLPLRMPRPALGAAWLLWLRRRL